MAYKLDEKVEEFLKAFWGVTDAEKLHETAKRFLGEAYDAGHDDGVEDGFQQGQEEGYTQGYNDREEESTE